MRPLLFLLFIAAAAQVWSAASVSPSSLDDSDSVVDLVRFRQQQTSLAPRPTPKASAPANKPPSAPKSKPKASSKSSSSASNDIDDIEFDDPDLDGLRPEYRATNGFSEEFFKQAEADSVKGAATPEAPSAAESKLEAALDKLDALRKRESLTSDPYIGSIRSNPKPKPKANAKSNQKPSAKPSPKISSSASSKPVAKPTGRAKPRFALKPAASKPRPAAKGSAPLKSLLSSKSAASSSQSSESSPSQAEIDRVALASLKLVMNEIEETEEDISIPVEDDRDSKVATNRSSLSSNSRSLGSLLAPSRSQTKPLPKPNARRPSSMLEVSATTTVDREHQIYPRDQEPPTSFSFRPWHAEDEGITPLVKEPTQTAEFTLYRVQAAGTAVLELRSADGKLNMGGQPGRWKSDKHTLFTAAEGGTKVKCFWVNFIPEAAMGQGEDVKKRRVMCPKESAGFTSKYLRRKWLSYLQATVWPVEEGQMPQANEFPLPSTLPMAPPSETHPGWRVDPQSEDEMFEYAYEVEGRSRYILQYYMPDVPGVPQEFWASLTQAQREYLFTCFFKKKEDKDDQFWSAEYPRKCKRRFIKLITPNSKSQEAKYAGKLVEGLYKFRPRPSFASFVLCPQCMNDDATGLPANKRPRARGTASCAPSGSHEPGLHNMREWMPSRLKQEGRTLWELAPDGPRRSLDQIGIILKCIKEMLFDERQHRQFPSSMHIHMSFRPPTSIPLAQAVASYVVWVNDVFFLDMLTTKLSHFDSAFFSIPSQTAVLRLLTQQIPLGLVKIEDRIKGVSWGEYKKAFVALRHNIYGPGRWGIEFRIGSSLVPRYARISKSIPGWEMPPRSASSPEALHDRMRMITDDSISLIKWFRRPLTHHPFTLSSPVKFGGLTRQTPNPWTVYQAAAQNNQLTAIGNLLHYVLNQRRSTSCDSFDSPDKCLWVPSANMRAGNSAQICGTKLKTEVPKMGSFHRLSTFVVFTLWEEAKFRQGQPAVKTAAAARFSRGVQVMQACAGDTNANFESTALMFQQIANKVWSDQQLQDALWDNI